MKKLFVTVLMMVSTLAPAAHADIWDLINIIKPSRPSGPSHPSYPGHYPGYVTCRADDKGWEEHSSHRSCGECLSLHGECEETCSTIDYSCRAVGYDRQGRQVTVYGQAQDRYYAERQAYDTCYYRGLQGCYIERCDQRENVISRRDCR